MGKQWLQAAMTLITVEGASCDEWREREAILRLLTSDVRDFEADYKFKPLETLEVLRQIQNGQGLDLQGDTGNNAQISADVWNHQRIASGEKLPNRFDFSPPDVSMKTMTPYESQDPPKNGQFCIVQLADGSLDCGKWIYRALQAGGNAVMMFRLAGSSGMNIQSQTTEDELPQVIAIECI
jgi:hypothetical protein